MSERLVCIPESLPSSVWRYLSAAMNTESTIMNTRTSPESLADVYEKGLATVMMVDGEVVGFAAAWPVQKGFVEVGSVWVRADHRGKRYGTRLYASIDSLLAMNNLVAFAITQNPIALKAGYHAGLREHPDWRNPVPWRLTCAPCTWMPKNSLDSCPHRNNTCWLRVRKS